MGRTETVSTQKTTMKNIFLLSIVSLAILQPLAEAIFLGPIAVGVALGAVAVKKGLILGSVLSQRRTSHRSGRIYTRYNRRSHYTQPRTYYQHYTQPRTYYYSSDNHYDNHHDHHYGKRFAAPEPISMEELMRLKGEVTDKIMTDDWYMEMVEKDQDDCTKRLICEISSKKENGEVLTEVESRSSGSLDKAGLSTPQSPPQSSTLLPRPASTGRREATGASSSPGATLPPRTSWP